MRHPLYVFSQVECEDERLKFTLTDPDDLIEWVNVINDSARSLKKRSATLKKPSSNAKPIKRDQIKTILRENKKGQKRPASHADSPGPSPGKLRRFFNVSGRLDEIVDYLSPSRASTPVSPLRRLNISTKSEASAIILRNYLLRNC
jgi:hypothetical protein